jgi:biopolymer transport protein TolR
MARTFRRHRATQPIAELNVTNLIDVAFTLLIVFMIVTPLIQQEQTIPVELPVQSITPQQKQDPKDRFETITVQPDGNVLLGNRVLTLSQLNAELDAFAADPRPPVFRLRFDARSSAQQFIVVMDELQKRNLTRISFDTQTSR